MTEPERARAIKAVQLVLCFAAEEYRPMLLAHLNMIERKGTKICRSVRCRVRKPVTEFYRDTRYSDKRYPYCKDCKRAMVMKNYRPKAA